MKRGVAAALMVWLVAACAGDPKLDMAAATSVLNGYVDSNYASIEHGDATCPTDVPMKLGTEFECVVPFGDATLHIRVTQTDDDGAVTYEPVEAVFVADDLEVDLARQVVDQLVGTVTVDCGSEAVFVVAPGDTFECTASNPIGDRRTITGTVADINGRYTIAVS